MLKSFVVCSFLALLVCACAGQGPRPEPPATPRPEATPAPTIEPTPTESILTLNMWLPDWLVPDNSSGARMLAARLSEFAAQHPGVEIRVRAKKDRGPGGLLDLLRTAGPVAPQALPDLIVLSGEDLTAAARDGAVQPLDALLSPEADATAFSFARDAARFEGRRVGLPWIVDFRHAVYRPDQSEAPPADWTDIISSPLRFHFTFTEGNDVSDFVLADYLQLSGGLTNADGQPALQVQSLASLLTRYRDARNAGSIDAAALDWASDDAAWAAFQAGDALTVAPASRFLAAQADAPNLRYARTPAVDGAPSAPLGRSWHIAVVTRDPRRQALAAELMAYLAQEDFLADWTQAQNVIPATTEALARWDRRDGYAAFARSELSRAISPPPAAAVDEISPRLLQAIRDVMLGRLTPLAAAQAAAEATASGEP